MKILPQRIFSALFPLRSLKTRVTLFTLAIFVISIWTLTFYAGRMLRTDMQRLLGDQQFSTVSLVAAEIDQELDERLQALGKIAEQISIPVMMGNRAALQTTLEHRPVFQAMFNFGVFVTRPDGTAIVDVPRSTGRLGLNFMDRDHIAGALGEGKASIGRPVEGKALRAPIIGMSAPILDPQGNVIGALVGSTDLNKPNFLDRIVGSSYGKTGGYLVVAPKHRLIVTATDKSRIMEASPAPGIFPLIDRFLQGYEGTGILVNPLGAEVLQSAKGIPSAGWYVAVQLPSEEAFAPIRGMQQRILLAAVLLTLLAGGLTWWMLRRQLSPMLAAVKTLAILSDVEQHPQPLPITRRDEIGDLIGGFNRLLETLGKREAALRESEERYRALVENANDLVYRMDGTGHVTYVNASGLRITGYEQDELIGKNYSMLVHPDMRDDAVRFFGRQFVKRINSTYSEFPILTKEGNEVWLGQNTELVVKDGEVIGFQAVSRDITERKRMEETLRESELKYRNILESIEDGYFEVDIAGNLTFFNDSVCQILGYTLAELMGMNNRRYIDKESNKTVYQTFNEVFRTGNPSKGVGYEIIRKDGTKLFIESSASLIKDSMGQPTGFRGIMRNITERKNAEKKLQDTLESLRKAVGTTIQVLASVVEARDPYTAGHQVRVADLARTIAVEMGLPQDKVDGIRIAGSIHDIGKISVPAEILSKPTKLSEIEFALIKAHSQKGYEMLKDVESPWPLAQIVYQHHERMDGSGYPRNLKGDGICIEARILTVADVVEAMASHRPYRPGLGIDKALNEIDKNKGIYYDSAVADACLRLFREKGFQLSEIRS